MHNHARFAEGKTMPEHSPASLWRKPPWIAFLIIASAVFSLGFACAVPLAAFAAIAALTLNRRDALALVGAVWLANQFAGFAIHHYPLAPSTFAWGLGLGTVALASTIAALWVKERLPQTGAAAAFVAAFAVYEGSLLAISLAVGSGVSNFSPAIVSRILAINIAAFAALFLIHRLGALAGSVKMPPKFAGRQRRA
jgi:hypothetical protein